MENTTGRSDELIDSYARFILRMQTAFSTSFYAIPKGCSFDIDKLETSLKEYYESSSQDDKVSVGYRRHKYLFAALGIELSPEGKIESVSKQDENQVWPYNKESLAKHFGITGKSMYRAVSDAEKDFGKGGFLSQFLIITKNSQSMGIQNPITQNDETQTPTTDSQLSRTQLNEFANLAHELSMLPAEEIPKDVAEVINNLLNRRDELLGK